MTDLFPHAVAIILDLEGPPSNDPLDPGGATVFGIARRYHPNEPWPPSRDRAIQIYRDEYWTAHRCGELPWAFALGVFDGVVNQDDGVIVAAQQALGINADGKVGQQTITAAHFAPEIAFDDFLARRALAYTRSKNFPRDGHGWLKRLMQIAREAAVIPGGAA